MSGKTGKPLNGIGDGASFSPGAGTALARVGARCIELSGLRAGAKRVTFAITMLSLFCPDSPTAAAARKLGLPVAVLKA